MNNHQHKPIAYHGKWRVPQYNSCREIIGYQECMGMLTCDDNGNILELYHEPKQGVISSMYEYHEVIHGQDANGYVFTLFESEMTVDHYFTKTTYIAKIVLVDRKVESLDEPVYDECYVKYPYLKDWAFCSRLNIDASNDSFVVELDTKDNTTLFEMNIEGGVKLSLWKYYAKSFNRYDLSIIQDTQLTISSKNKISIKEYLKYIAIFNNFLSISLFGKQFPSIVEFKNRKEIQRHKGRMFYEIEPSVKPSKQSFLIDFNKNKDRLQTFLNNWFLNYEQMKPICNYLIDSIDRKTFDTPNFLTIAQALDGYFKRFVNKKDGKNTKQYEHQIKKLLEHFKGVHLIKKCKLDAKVLAHSRNKYSHLIPDDETKNIEKAVKGDELKTLTQKAIILLVCCILDNIGMTTDEINTCLDGHYLNIIASDIEFY